MQGEPHGGGVAGGVGAGVRGWAVGVGWWLAAQAGYVSVCRDAALSKRFRASGGATLNGEQMWAFDVQSRFGYSPRAKFT